MDYRGSSNLGPTSGSDPEGDSRTSGSFKGHTRAILGVLRALNYRLLFCMWSVMVYNGFKKRSLIGDPRIGNSKNVGGIQEDQEEPGGYIPMIFLLSSWGFLFCGLH